MALSTHDSGFYHLLTHDRPTSLLCILTHHSNIFRKMMIGRIAAHLADFSPRLRSNTRAIYQYCPMPHVTYPQLEAELFCSIFYLRHLCDTARFPDWPIADPVSRGLVWRCT